jgi:hypothetical protein
MKPIIKRAEAARGRWQSLKNWISQLRSQAILLTILLLSSM